MKTITGLFSLSLYINEQQLSIFAAFLDKKKELENENEIKINR